jgi:hypothetical protein
VPPEEPPAVEFGLLFRHAIITEQASADRAGRQQGTRMRIASDQKTNL